MDSRMRANVAWGFCMKIALTGHRPDKLNNEWDGRGPCSDWLRTQLAPFVAEASIGISGMALGADLLWAEEILKAGKQLWAAIPFEGQAANWSKVHRERYEKIISRAERFVLSRTFTNKSIYQARNIWMVDRCDLLIAIWDGTPGGTDNCRRYAEKVGRPIERINPREWRS